MSVHSFPRSLAIGKAGESYILSKCPDLIKLDGYKSDFLLPDGRQMELKVDSYDVNKTGNFFMESFSDLDRLKRGGVWQASANGSHEYWYYFSANKLLYKFQVDALLAFMIDWELNTRNKATHVRNTRWTTVGYKVPRTALAGLYSEETLGV